MSPKAARYLCRFVLVPILVLVLVPVLVLITNSPYVHCTRHQALLVYKSKVIKDRRPN